MVLVLKRLRRRDNGLKSHPTDWEKPGIEPATPGLQDIGLSPTPRRLLIIFFCGFPWVETSTAGRVYELCVYYMTGAPKGSPKVVLCGFFYVFFFFFMEKPGIEPATPGLQGIALIHYTTGASQVGFEKLSLQPWLKNIYRLVIRINGFKKCRHTYP